MTPSTKTNTTTIRALDALRVAVTGWLPDNIDAAFVRALLAKRGAA